MADTASLIARVKTEGVEEASRQLTALGRTSEQVDTAIARMTGDVGKTNKAMSDAARGGLSSFRNAAGQVGFQVQDMVVQLQSGTSAFVAIGQQGSQLAGAFGPGGAVLGAVIALAAAVGGVLYKAFTDTGASAKDLEKGASDLAHSFQSTKDGTIELSDAMVTLSQNGDLAYGSMVKLIGLKAQQQLQNTTKALKEQSNEWLDNSVAGQTAAAQLDEMIKKGQDVAGVLDNINVISDASSGQYANLASQVSDIADRYGLTTKQVSDLLVAQRNFNAQPTAENAQKIADAQTAAAQAASNNKSELLDQAIKTQELANALKIAEAQLDAATAAQNRNGAAVNSTTKAYQDQTAQIIRNTQIGNLAEKDRIKAQADADKEAFAKRKGVTEQQIKDYNAARDEEARQDIQRINDTEAKKAAAEQKAADNKAAAEAKRAENLRQQQEKQAQNFLDTLARQNSDELAAIDAQERQKLAKLQEFQQTGAINAQQFEDAKTKIMLEADTARQEELDKRKEEQRKKDQKGDDFMAQIQGQNASELQLLDIQQKQKEAAAKAFYDQGILNEESYQGALADIQASYNRKRVAAYQSMLGETTDNLRTALGEGNKMYKSFAIANAIMNTYQGAVAAFQSAAAIPLVGWIAAPVAAAAAVAAGLANVAKIRSAREQGGSLAAGGIAMVGERNKAELIMPAGASRVRTMEQVQQMMGGKPNNNGNGGVVIVNNTSAKIDSATTETDNEGRLRVIISETVSRALQDSNSDISKSRRATRGQPGFQ